MQMKGHASSKGVIITKRHGPYRSPECYLNVSLGPCSMKSRIIILLWISELNSDIQEQYKAGCDLKVQIPNKMLILMSTLHKYVIFILKLYRVSDHP